MKQTNSTKLLQQINNYQSILDLANKEARSTKALNKLHSKYYNLLAPVYSKYCKKYNVPLDVFVEMLSEAIQNYRSINQGESNK